jgi:Flp pilus assembly protein TadB
MDNLIIILYLLIIISLFIRYFIDIKYYKKLKKMDEEFIKSIEDYNKKLSKSNIYRVK